MSLELSPANAIVEECIRLRKNIQPISEKYHGLLDKSTVNNTKYPFVLLLGNHSSGKSSFINYLLNRKIQQTGVAPTDDGFTIIGHGPSDVDKSGPALVGDPDLGFSGLQMFGTQLVNHTHLKIRSDVSIKDFMIVDSPGMIDSPDVLNDPNRNSKSAVHSGKMDRGYNFEGVVRWYAERADVILLFFDPDKPGTTGETLSILTNSLVGLDHKLHIILNKADQFHRIHDFARAYGSLCWNLSKVILRKDLPKIHTMCLPASAIQLDNLSSVSHNIATDDQTLTHEDGFSEEAVLRLPGGLPPSGRKTRPFFDQGRVDLDEAREEVLREVSNAPRRRVDNEISRLSDDLGGLLMHCGLVESATRAYHSQLWRGRLLVVGTAVLSVALTVGAGCLFDYLAAGGSAGKDSSGPSTTTKLTTTATKPGGGGGGGVKLKADTIKAPVVSLAVLQSSAHSVAVASWSVLLAVTNLFRFQSKTTLYGFCGAGGLIATALTNAYAQFSLKREAVRLVSKSHLEASFRELHGAEIARKDQYSIALGDLVVDHLVSTFGVERLAVCPSVRKEDRASLTRILVEDVANLRRRASPNFPMLVPVSTPVRNASNNFWSSGDKRPVPLVELSRALSDVSIAASLSSSSIAEFPVIPHIFSSSYEQSPAESTHSLAGLLIESDLTTESLLVPEETPGEAFSSLEDRLRNANSSTSPPDGEEYASPKELSRGDSLKFEEEESADDMQL